MTIDGGYLDVPSVGASIWRRDRDGMWAWRMDVTTLAGHHTDQGTAPTYTQAQADLADALANAPVDDQQAVPA